MNNILLIFNRMIALILIIVFLPLFAFVSLMLLLEDGFPIFFMQKRIGINNTSFILYKFRTMSKNTPNVATHLLEDPEEYILSIGKFLRKYSIDELPNLVNILLGKMVFIGPRPALYNQHDLIKLRTDNGIHRLIPGLTGWAQVNGRDEISIQEKVKLEKWYLENRCMKIYLKIFLLTFLKTVDSEGVTH